MAVNIATLAIKFVADTSGIKQGVSSVVSNVLTGAAAFIGINKAISAFSSGAERIDKMSKVADRLGVSFKTIQQAALTADLAGIELDSLTDAIDKMSKNIGSGGMSLDKRFLEQADAIAAIVDPAEQARKAMEVFGKSGAKLLPMLKGGKNAFREAADFIDRFDLAISDIDAKNVERMNDSWTKMGAIITGTTDKIISKMAPSMGVFLDHTIDQMAELGKSVAAFGVTWEGVGEFITEIFAELANQMSLAMSQFEQLQAVAAFATGGDAMAHQAKANALLNDFLKGTPGERLKAEVGKRAGDGGPDAAGRFGGIETKFASGADKGSQAAAKLINAAAGAPGAQSEADKKAAEIARNTAATKAAVERIAASFAGNVPVLALGGL